MESNTHDYVSYVFSELQELYGSSSTKLWLNNRLLTLTVFVDNNYYDFILLKENSLSKEDFVKGIMESLDDLINKK